MATPSKPIILWNNLVETKLINTITSEVAGKPKERMHDWRTFLQWQSDGTATQDIVIDMGAALSVAPDYLAIVNHDLGTGTCNVQVDTDTTNAFPSVLNVLASTAITTDEPKYYALAASTERWWRIRFTSVPAGGIKIGELFLGYKYQLPKLPDDGFDLLAQERIGQINQSLQGNLLGSGLIYGQRKIPVSIRAISEADAITWETFIQSHGGKMKPFLFLPDITNYPARIYYAMLTEARVNLPTRGQYRSINFEIMGPVLKEY